MRAILFTALLFTTFGMLTSSFATAQAPAVDTITWARAFTPQTAGQADDRLTLILISNDEDIEADLEGDEGKSKQPIWCKADLEFSYRRVLAKRPELSDQCTLQYQAAGMPRRLSGGEDRNKPARCVVAICDGRYRLLSFCVGTPTPDELFSLIEDAQEVAGLIKLTNSEQHKITTVVTDRSMQRLTRRWQQTLTAVLADIDVGATDNADENSAAFDVAPAMRRITSAFEDIYLVDVKLRFGLTDATDRIRLAVLEQHPETRAPWCNSMIPFVASADFTKIWRPLVRAVWHYDPVTMDGDAPEKLSDASSKLIQWYDSNDKNRVVILNLQESARYKPTPRASALTGYSTPKAAPKKAGGKLGVLWAELQSLVKEFPTQNIAAQELSDLVRLRDIQGVDTLAKFKNESQYLVIDTIEKSSWAIYANESPAKSIGRLKRALKK